MGKQFGALEDKFRDIPGMDQLSIPNVPKQTGANTRQADFGGCGVCCIRFAELVKEWSTRPEWPEFPRRMHSGDVTDADIARIRRELFHVVVAARNAAAGVAT